jgi:DNA-directed RNA polymerase subunit RPC12/RpoP
MPLEALIILALFCFFFFYWFPMRSYRMRRDHPAIKYRPTAACALMHRWNFSHEKDGYRYMACGRCGVREFVKIGKPKHEHDRAWVEAGPQTELSDPHNGAS